jgi:predicted nucleic acid-binding protein
LKGVVVDASVALAWCFPDEASEYADGVLVALEGQTLLVRAVWGLEIANAVLAGERSKRLRPPEIRRFAILLESLPLVQDVQPVGEHFSNVLPVAREYGLSAYDAA